MIDAGFWVRGKDTLKMSQPGPSRASLELSVIPIVTGGLLNRIITI